MSWELTKLSEIADVQVGFAFSSKKFLNEDQEGIFLLRGDNLQQGYIRWGDKAKKWANANDSKLEKYLLKKGDVVLAMDRPIVAGGLKIAKIIDKDLPCYLVQRVMRLRGISKQDTNYIFHILRSPSFINYIESITTGANIPHISHNEVIDYEFLAPPEKSRETLSTLINNYDDLIQINQQRIALLEEAAQRLYDEWFVKLRFPNHEQVPVVEGVPEGWEKVYLADIAYINANTLKKDEFEYINYVDISSVEERRIQNQVTVPIAEAAGRAKRKVKHGDIIWACVRPNRRQFALVWRPSKNLIVSTGFSTIAAKNIPFTYLYLLSDHKLFSDYLENVAIGVAYPAVTANDFESYEIVKPTEQLLYKFDKIVLPLVEQAENLKVMNQKLTQARDELLPRLMSGQLDLNKLLEPEAV